MAKKRSRSTIARAAKSGVARVQKIAVKAATAAAIAAAEAAVEAVMKSIMRRETKPRGRATIRKPMAATKRKSAPKMSKKTARR
jgi:hypothetical protein